MKKRIFKSLVLFLSVFFLMIFAACQASANMPNKENSDENQSKSSEDLSASISGKVVYSNGSIGKNGGIIVTLESSDGMRTAAVARAIQNRSVVNSSRSIVDSVVTDYTGSYYFSKIKPGFYTIYASSNCSAERAVYTNVYADKNAETIVRNLELTATGSIKGTITIDGNSRGNSGFLVFVAGTSYMAMTDDKGNYTISGIPAGDDYSVIATKDGVTYNIETYISIPANSTKTLTTKNFSSEELKAAVKGKDGASIVWLGSFASASNINNPKYLNAYYNTTDGCSYIYNGDEWELLANSGADGEQGTSIIWQGERSSAPDDPEVNWAYFDTEDGCSYIWDGVSWNRLSEKGSSGNDGTPIIWKGENWDAPSDPELNWAYYSTKDTCSYIWNGWSWDKLTSKGDIGITWKGESWDAPWAPRVGWAYYNIEDGCSYIWDGEEWNILASKGGEGNKGEDGKSINWRGNYFSSDDISDPQNLDAYYNITDGCSYIYDGRYWKILSSKGDKGSQGDKGDTGASIVWKGSYSNASEIEDPQNLWAYYNITDGCSYIYANNEWQLFARNGADGATSSSETGITWLGSYASASEIPSPEVLDAYYNTTDGCSYIYNGTEWKLLAKGGINGINGTNGTNGLSINWLGSYTSADQIYNPQKLDAYYNTTENCAYIYNGSKWTVLINGPASGATGGSSSTNTGSTTGANVSGSTLLSWNNPEGVIRIPNGVTDISAEVFNNKDKITGVIIPSSVENIGNSAFYDCDNLTSVQFLGSGLKIISQSAFYSCDNLTSISFPDTLTTIGESAFKGCVKLTSMTLPPRLQTIGASAFYNCKAITTVNIPNSVIRIDANAYSNCIMLRTLTIGRGLTKLAGATFSDCDSLTSVTIPDNVVAITHSVFLNCDSLVTVSVTGTWNNGCVLTVADLKNSNVTNFTYTRD